jgi:hypothetical protein
MNNVYFLVQKNVYRAKLHTGHRDQCCGYSLVFYADPDPAFYLDADSDPGSQSNVDPDPIQGQTLPSQKVDFLDEK